MFLEIPTYKKNNSQILLKSFDALMGCSFRCIDIKVYHKSAIEFFFLTYLLPDVAYAGHLTSSLEVIMARYVWTKETEYFFHKSTRKQDLNVTRRYLTRTKAEAIHTIQWKHMEIAILFWQNFQSIAFILQKTEKAVAGRLIDVPFAWFPYQPAALKSYDIAVGPFCMFMFCMLSKK